MLRFGDMLRFLVPLTRLTLLWEFAPPLGLAPLLSLAALWGLTPLLGLAPLFSFMHVHVVS